MKKKGAIVFVLWRNSVSNYNVPEIYLSEVFDVDSDPSISLLLAASYTFKFVVAHPKDDFDPAVSQGF